MATNISWCDEVWNVVTGCNSVSKGCRYCYAKQIHDMRHKAYHEGKKIPEQYKVPFETVLFHEKRLEIPLRRKKPTTYFVNSMSDLFHKDVPDWFIYQVFKRMNHVRDRHTFIILTKRPERMKSFITNPDVCGYCSAQPFVDNGILMPHVYFGVSVENQKSFDERVPILLETPVENKILSIEPLVGEIDIEQHLQYQPLHDNYKMNFGNTEVPSLKAVIIGGESGKNARECSFKWFIDIIGNCRDAEVPVYLKQLGRINAKKFGLKNRNGANYDEICSHWNFLAPWADVNNLPWKVGK